MNIRDAALRLNEFDKAVATLPETSLKKDLKTHVDYMFNMLMKECLMRTNGKHGS